MSADHLLRSDHSRFVDRDGFRWHVQVAGPEQADVLLLLHGTGASSQSFRDLLPYLAEHHRVVAPDLPGQGETRAPRGFRPSLTNMADAVASLLTGMKVVVTAAVGHSAGAAILAQMIQGAHIAPRSLIGIAAAMMPFEGLANVVFPSMARALAGSGLAAALVSRRFADARKAKKVLEGTGSRLSARGVEVYRQLASKKSHVEAVLSMMAAWDLQPLFDALPELDTPFLLLAGELDRAVPVAQQRQVARRLPNARLVVIPQAGHLVHEEQPHEVSRLILEAVTSEQR